LGSIAPTSSYSTVFADFEVTDADPAADPGAAVGSGRGDLRRRELRFENGDAPVELCLLLEQVEQRRIVGEVAVLTSVSEPLAQLGTDAASQPFEFDAQVFVSPGRDQQAVISGRCGQCVHVGLLSVREEVRSDRPVDPAGGASVEPWGERCISVASISPSVSELVVGDEAK
jgi:hypothetical protein